MNALINIWDRIALAVITAFPRQWDDLNDIFDEED